MSYMLFMMWIFFIPLHIARRVYITAKYVFLQFMLDIRIINN